MLAAGALHEINRRGKVHVPLLIGIVLFVLTFLVNLTADIVVKGIKGQAND